MSHWSIILSIILIHQTVLKDIIDRLLCRGGSKSRKNQSTQLLIFPLTESTNPCIVLRHLFHILADIWCERSEAQWQTDHRKLIPFIQSSPVFRQKRWTVKYKSLTYIYFLRSMFVSHWSIIQCMTFLHQIVLKTLSEITEPQNISHWPTFILWGQSLCNTDPLS